MKKLVALLLSLCLVFGMLAVASAGTYTPGTYEGTGKGYGETVKVTVKVTVDEEKITAVEITGDEEVPFGQPQFDTYAAAVVEKQSADIDAVAGATMTRDGVKEAVENALAAARGEEKADSAAELAFKPGTYEATADGYNGVVTAEVTFSESRLENVVITGGMETQHVGDVAFDIMIPEMVEVNGSGVDGVSGATFSSRALRNIVNSAAEQAECTNLDAFKAARKEHVAGDPLEYTADVVVVGAGGAGIAAAAQAKQNGLSVLVIEKNAEVGGNTLVSGGQFQSVMPYVVWDPNDPDATTGVYPHNGQTYNKYMSKQGCINELKNILSWSEEPFDEAYYQENEFVAGDAVELAKHGVHQEYLPVLQELKKEIQAYLDWAEPKLEAGTSETQLPLFSTINLHIFQTYYGGLRQSADKSQWIYGDIDLVTQFIQDGQGLKEWLEDQGAHFLEDQQNTLIGALWYRENEYEPQDGNWGTYFVGPVETIGKDNILLRTTATDLIVEDGKVVGVKATKFDGTEVTAHASKGVVLATGGFAANIDMVLENNVYWDTKYLTTSTKTTNRSSQKGDGIAMAQAVGADVTGMGFTQLMPISWVDNGNLAFGGGNYACWINPTTGKRFVDEGSERDVLSLAEFRNGIVKNNTPGVFVEFYNAAQKVPGPPTAQLLDTDYPGRYYHIKGTVEALTALFADPEFEGVTADPATVLETIKAYDKCVMEKADAADYPDVPKGIASRTIGNVEVNEDGSYIPETYNLEETDLIVRLMAPSTHHTMGGVKVDTKRHVLDKDGNIIPGLYAAGEVTGGIHGGNRLGGNAIVEIFVSGRTAAYTITDENK